MLSLCTVFFLFCPFSLKVTTTDCLSLTIIFFYQLNSAAPSASSLHPWTFSVGFFFPPPWQLHIQHRCSNVSTARPLHIQTISALPLTLSSNCSTWSVHLIYLIFYCICLGHSTQKDPNIFISAACLLVWVTISKHHSRSHHSLLHFLWKLLIALNGWFPDM